MMAKRRTSALTISHSAELRSRRRPKRRAAPAPLSQARPSLAVGCLFSLHDKALPGNPYDRHRPGAIIPAIEEMKGAAGSVSSPPPDIRATSAVHPGLEPSREVD